jgi:hypothetical protein
VNGILAVVYEINHIAVILYSQEQAVAVSSNKQASQALNTCSHKTI